VSLDRFAALVQADVGAPLVRGSVDLAPPVADEVDVEVATCSLCHSDLHLLDGDWTAPRPLVPGHEIVGRVVRFGPDVTQLGLGARVGVGWQSGACGGCGPCTRGRAHLCTGGKERTCVGRPGGFARFVRARAPFCFPIPAELDDAHAAPLLCAGLTVFSPLARFGVGSGVRVGVVGCGGLGHLAIAFARAHGADVIAFDSDMSRAELATSLGASEMLDARGTLPREAVDLLLVTTHAALDFSAWLSVVRLEGTMCLVGVPPGPVVVDADGLLDGQKTVTGSVVGSPGTMREMLAFAAAHGVTPVIETAPLSRANDAVDRLREGRVRMRVVLEQDL
jgi:alcohol/geraniol dehydrogenase (NADP+)